MFHVKQLYIDYKGRLEGMPSLRGNLSSVLFFFSIRTLHLEKSDEGRIKSKAFAFFPPSIPMALAAPVISSLESPDLYETNTPPTFTKGIQYSLNTERLATARDTTMSYCSRYFSSCASTSALA